MTDSGRGLFKSIESDERLTEYTVDGVHKTPDEAAMAAADLLKSGDVALVAHAIALLREQYIQSQLVSLTGAKVFMVSYVGEGDGILLSEDRSPNLRGAILNGLSDF